MIGASNKVLVKDFEISIAVGDRWAIVGPNGCGKSTTMRLIGDHYIGGHGEDGSNSQARDGPFGTIAFESHRKLLQDELREYRESRSDVTKLRATLASYLFPDLAPEDPEFAGGFRATSKDGTAVGYRPPPTRLAPLFASYDAIASDPMLAELEAAVTGGESARLLELFGLRDVRHRPVFAMSTGEARKMLIMQYLLTPPQLWVLDETFDGLDEASRFALRDELARLEAGGGDRDAEGRWADRAIALITHHAEEIMEAPAEEGVVGGRVLAPTHALLLGQGDDGTAYAAGQWDEMQPRLDEYFRSQREAQWVRPAAPKRVKPPRSSSSSGSKSGSDGKGEGRAPLVDFRGISVRYNSHVVFDQLSWLVREGEKWVVVGGNGTGKSTLVELITGDNVQGYQNDVRLFGRQKGSGESIWQIKAQLGVLSTEFHMEYIDYADPSVRTAFRKPDRVTTWEVVCSGFFDSMGLYNEVSLEQRKVALEWIQRLELSDLITPPPMDTFTGSGSGGGGAGGGSGGGGRLQGGGGGGSGRTAAAAKARAAVAAGKAVSGGGRENFFHLSHGQQKLVLLCRAMVKPPRLLLLDEPTHGLSGRNKERLLYTLGLLGEEEEVAVVYVTHRQEEIDALGFEHVLQLGASSSRR